MRHLHGTAQSVGSVDDQSQPLPVAIKADGGDAGFPPRGMVKVMVRCCITN